jgi:hypothetical protein
MQQNWFKKWGWIYRPTSLAGWFLSLVCFFMIVRLFIFVDGKSHSGSDTLIGVFPWAWIALATLNWIASKTSER